MVHTLLGSTPFQAQGGDRLVSRAVGAAIAALFKRSEKVEANVRAEPVTKLLQGSIDGFDFLGSGMLMYNGLRIAVMELYLQAVSIEFGAIFTGQVKLRQPTQASMRVVLSEADLTDSFNTPFVKDKLQRLQYQGQSLDFNNTEMTVTPEKQLRVQSLIQLKESGSLIPIDFITEVEVQERRKIQFVNVTHRGEAEAIELSQALVEHVNSLLDLDKFALEGTQLRVDRLRIQNDSVIFYGSAHINQFPTGKKRS
ncbi:MAG: LmeA family phospholipid-binding protein [Microcoleaceae cyanobacterium]